MTGQITYSFVIPHYNIPSLLNRCLDSIPCRDDIQIIVVDDGSIDKPKLLRQDVELILLKEHTNAGHARNVGLGAARGKWVLFADADDFYNSCFIAELDEYAGSNDQIVFFSEDSRDSETLELRDDRSKGIVDHIDRAYYDDKDSLNRLFFQVLPVHYMMFSRDFLQSFDIHFDEVPIHNDVLFHLNSCYHLSRYAIIPKQLYCITYRKGSITYSGRSFDDYLTLLKNFYAINKFYDYAGLHEYKCSKRTFFLFGCDNLLFRRTKVEKYINHIVYFVKIHLVLIVKFKAILSAKDKYVNEIKRSSLVFDEKGSYGNRG